MAEEEQKEKHPKDAVDVTADTSASSPADNKQKEAEKTKSGGQAAPEGKGAAAKPEGKEGKPKPDAKEGKAKPDAKEGKAKPDAKEGKAGPEGKAKPDAKEGKAGPEGKEAEAKPDAKEGKAGPEAKEDTLQSVLEDGEDAAKPADDAQGKRRNLRRVPFGIAHVRATFNNTVVTITDAQGAVLGWSSGGRSGFKGSRKSTAFAAGRVGQDAARQALARGMKEVEVRIQGPGAGRETAIRALQSAGLTIAVIKDVTPMPHNGCRPRKRRRV